MGALLTFLKGFSIKQYLFAGIAILALTFGLKIFGAIQGHFVRVDNLEQANKELEQQKLALENQKQSDNARIETLELTLEVQRESLTIINGEFAEARNEAEKQKRVLEGSRLARIAAEQAARIESLSNKATNERLTEIEGIINEDL